MPLSLFLLIALFPYDTNPKQVSDEETLRNLKEVLWPQAYREQDTILLDKILAEEFQMIDAQGKWSNKKGELNYIREHKPSYDAFRYEIRRLEVFENGTAIISGVGHIKGKDEEGPYLVTYHSSNVLIKRGRAWKAISSHVSGVSRSSGDS